MADYMHIRLRITRSGASSRFMTLRESGVAYDVIAGPRQVSGLDSAGWLADRSLP